MQSNWSSKRDWHLFRNKLAGWQEAYIGRLNKEYIELLRGDGSEADISFGSYASASARIDAVPECRSP